MWNHSISFPKKHHDCALAALALASIGNVNICKLALATLAGATTTGSHLKGADDPKTAVMWRECPRDDGYHKVLTFTLTDVYEKYKFFLSLTNKSQIVRPRKSQKVTQRDKRLLAASKENTHTRFNSVQQRHCVFQRQKHPSDHGQRAWQGIEN